MVYDREPGVNYLDVSPGMAKYLVTASAAQGPPGLPHGDDVGMPAVGTTWRGWIGSHLTQTPFESHVTTSYASLDGEEISSLH